MYSAKFVVHTLIMGRGTEALLVLGLGVLGASAKFGAQLSMDKIPVTEDASICAIKATDNLKLRSVPTTLDNDHIGILKPDERLPYTGSAQRIRGQNVDPNRSDGADWWEITTVDGRHVFASAIFSTNTCPERTIAGVGTR